MENNDLYLESGYFNAAAVIEAGHPFNIVMGGRATGKTYGFIDWFIRHQEPFILMRRTQKESDLQGDPETSSLGPNMRDMGFSIIGKRIAGSLMKVLNADTGDEICLCMGMNATATIRGMDLSRFKYALYDEFIPEPHVRAIKNEGAAVFNMYETINRNRELSGKDPLMLICVSNAVNIANDVFIQGNLVSIAESLLSGDMIYQDDYKMMIMLRNSPISKQKEQTALYKGLASQEFKDMALDNKFIENDFTYIKKRKISEYVPLLQIGDLYVYGHKSRDEYYITFTKANLRNNQKYGSNYLDLTRLKREKMHLYFSYLDGRVVFEKYECLALFEKYYS